MAKTSATKLDARVRTPAGSRATRRLRREGRIPGVLYGGGADPIPFDVDARELRIALAARGAVLDLALDGETNSAVVKATDHHPVRGETTHIDLVRVNLNEAIQAVVTLELTGVDEAPGVVGGGVIEQVTREITIEALPNEIPESIVHDVSTMEMNDTVYLSAVSAPAGVTLVDAPEDTVVATLTPPKLGESDGDGIETETEVVGQAATPAAAEPSADAESAGTPSE
ncbi:MAG: ribosomal protein [Solirubrobacterales bacterium]|jgi:large subunit ribosomal protein L25|nr:ribosomal protein [Solirubrobacterales bacterium]